MSKRLEYEEVKQNIEYNNLYELISKEYINNSTKLEIKCPNGHIFKVTYRNFKNHGRRCPNCANNKKPSIDYIKLFTKNNETICKSNEYKNFNSKLIFICKQGHEYEMRWSDFRNGQRCSRCAGLKKYTIEFIKDFSLKSNIICLSNNYINNKHKLKFQCSVGHIFEMCFSNFKNLNQRCPDCFIEKNKGNNHPRWNPDRTRNRRANYLSFDLRKRSILKEDPLYKNYISNREQYNIDHIYPRIAFVDNDLDKQYDPKIIKQICNSIDNLQIISKEENLSKSGKYNQIDFMNWFNNKIKQYI